MNTLLKSTQGGDPDRLLTIGTLAERTGLSPATLRMWEQRHGFPTPHRLESGHRRYLEADVAAVERVVRRREAGVRLDVAIADSIADPEPGGLSVYAELRRKHPHVPVQRLRKRTLLALSWAIEDEFCAKAERAMIFGAFQHERHYEAARLRWNELAMVSGAAFVLAQFPGMEQPKVEERGPVLVPLPPEEPMAREWAIVCDSFELPAALTAWELPGQLGVPDREREFESMLTFDPATVRDAARTCARVAQRAGGAGASSVLHELADQPAPGYADLASVSAMLGRVLAYVDRFGG